jgi:hypothetical protein
MTDKISTLHRIILWLCVVSSFLFGLGYYLDPGFATSLLNVNAPDLIAISTIGGFLIAAFVGAALSLKSGLWSEVRIATYYLLTWSLLNGLRMLWFIFKEKEAGLWPNTILCLVIGIGLSYVVIKRMNFSKDEVGRHDHSLSKS